MSLQGRAAVFCGPLCRAWVPEHLMSTWAWGACPGLTPAPQRTGTTSWLVFLTSSRQLPTSVFFPRVPTMLPTPASTSANLPLPPPTRGFRTLSWNVPRRLCSEPLLLPFHPPGALPILKASPNSPPQSAAASLRSAPTGYCVPGHLPVTLLLPPDPPAGRSQAIVSVHLTPPQHLTRVLSICWDDRMSGC